MRAKYNLVLTRDGRIVAEGTESGWLWCIRGHELAPEIIEHHGISADLLEAPAEERAEPEPPPVIERDEVRRTRRRAKA